MKRCIVGTVFACVLLAAPNRASGQEAATYQLVLRGVPLEAALEALVRLTGVDLVYDTDLVQEREIFCVARNATAEALLQCILEDAGLEYVRSLSGAYVLIPAVRQPPVRGNLAGAVFDAETGAPLPYANIFLAEAGTGTAANESGLFTVASLLSGRYRVVVTYVGYQTAVDSVEVYPGGNTRMRIPLRSNQVSMAPVVVDGMQERLPSRGLGAAQVGQQRLSALTDFGVSDVTRAAASVSGINVQRPLADLHIQGSSAGTHVVVLDGAPVRDPVTLGRHLGAFSPLALGRMTVERAGFPASSGSNLAGRLSVEHDVASVDPTPVRFSVDPVSANVFASRRFGQTDRFHGRAMIAARGSVWQAYRSPYVDDLFRRWHAPDPLVTSIWIGQPVSASSMRIVSHRPEVAFSDLHGAVRMHPTPFQTLDASLYRARNRLGATVAAVNAPVTDTTSVFATDDLYNWMNWAGQVHHSWLLGPRTLVSTRVHGSIHESRYSYGTGLQYVLEEEDDDLDGLAREMLGRASTRGVSRESNRISEYTARADLQHSLSSRSEVEWGLSSTYVDSRFRLGSPYISPFAYDVATWQHAAYLQATLHLGFGTMIEPGLRVTYLPTRLAAYLEPRLAIRHDRRDTRLGSLAVRLAGGLYRQYVNEFELTSAGSTAVVPFVFFWLPVGSTLAPPRAFHLAADALLSPGERWTLSVSAYHKWQPRLLMLDYPALLAAAPPAGAMPSRRAQEDFITAAEGRAYGVDTRVRYAARGRELVGGYAYGRSTRTLHAYDSRAYSVPWNVPHQLFGGARASIYRGLEIELDARAGFGRTWQYRDAYYYYLPNRPGTPPLPDDPDASTLPPALTFDAGVRYQLEVGAAAVRLQVTVLNLLDRDVVYERNIAAAPDGGSTQLDRALPGRHLLLGVSVRQKAVR